MNNMKLSAHTGINFQAQLLSKTKALKYDRDNGEYNDVPVSFVEVSPKDSDDMKSVRNAVEYWDGDLYGMNIANSMGTLRWSTDENPSDKFFVITTQQKDFQKLNSDNIEAIAHIFETKKRVKVVHLQVNPDLIYTLEQPKYKHIGKSMIDSLKDKYNDRSINLISSSTAQRFYEKQGFNRTKDVENRYIWNEEAEADCKYKEEYW